MSRVIGVTEARIKLKAVLDEVKRRRESFILARGSKPEAVIISYEDYLSYEEKTRKLWNERFEAALKKSQALFKKWLRKQGYDPDKLTEEEIERIIQSA